MSALCRPIRRAAGPPDGALAAMLRRVKVYVWNADQDVAWPLLSWEYTDLEAPRKSLIRWIGNTTTRSTFAAAFTRST